MKRIISLIFALLMIASFCSVASAEKQRVFDNAELLSESERQNLEQQISDAMAKLNNEYEIAIVTLDYTRSYDDEQFAEEAIEIYEEKGFGIGTDKSGVMLLLDLSGGEGNRHINVLTHGKGKTALDDDMIDFIIDKMLPYFVSGDVMQGFEKYVSLTTQYITEYNANGKATTPPKSFSYYFMTILITVGGGLALALIVTGIFKAQLKSVAFKTTANDYVKQGSMKVRRAHDSILYRNVSRTSRSSDNDGSGGHSNSSSNSSYGGSGRSF